MDSPFPDIRISHRNERGGKGNNGFHFAQYRDCPFNVGSFQLTKHSKVYENPYAFDIKTIIKNDSLDLSLWYEYDAATGMSKKETDEMIQGFYDELSIRYRDFPIWSNLDREHLFLYIAYYKKNTNKIPDLSKLVDRVINKRINEKHIDIDGKNNLLYPNLNEGIFAGTFNFNWAQLHQEMMSGSVSENGLEKQWTNVLFDTNNNRIFTIPISQRIYLMHAMENRIYPK